MDMKEKESDIVRACLEYLKHRGIFSWRNNTAGIFNQKTGGYFFHGIAGVSDILGIIPNSGKLLAVECKTAKGRLSPAQEIFQTMISDNEGIAITARSVDELAHDLIGII